MTDAAGATSSNTVSITVNAGGPIATSMVVAPATVTKPLLGNYTYNNLKATLKSVGSNLPVSGVSIQFSVGGTNICSALTNASGVATCTAKGARKTNTTYHGQWPGNASYAASGGDGPLS